MNRAVGRTEPLQRGRPGSETNEGSMRVAIEAARRGLLAGEPPVGACLVRNGEVIATASNAVIGELDITAHAEIQVIRVACRELRALDLSDCRLFVTVEPCPMCMSACFYAGISVVVYGASLADMNAVTGRELVASDHQAFRKLFEGADEDGAPTVEITGGCLRDECSALLRQWADRISPGES